MYNIIIMTLYSQSYTTLYSRVQYNNIASDPHSMTFSTYGFFSRVYIYVQKTGEPEYEAMFASHTCRGAIVHR